jgi:octaprenyl-diphosphate synthase
MQNLKAIQAPINSEMKAFEPKFRDFMASKVALLDRITYYIVKRKGKQLRPMLVFLSAKLHGSIDESSYRGAALVELMHTATLVHDDVVDDSNMRRGFFSLNALWKNKIAVLVGDYLLSRVLLLSVEHKEHQLLELISTAVREMSEGELLQIEKARRLDIDEEVYFDIIKKKTASLIASCCAVGAASVKASTESIENMRLFGEYLGIAFQIKDDLFDFQKSGKAGKPTGIDIKEQKMTLPLIYALRNAEKRDKKFMIKVVKRYNHDRKKVEEVMSMVRHSGGIEYAEQQMLDYQAKALSILDQYPAGEVKNSLVALTEYVISRSK